MVTRIEILTSDSEGGSQRMDLFDGVSEADSIGYDPMEENLNIKEEENSIKESFEEDLEETTEDEGSEYKPDSDSVTSTRNPSQIPKKRKYQLRKRNNTSKKPITIDPLIPKPKRVKVIFSTTEVGESSKGTPKFASPQDTINKDLENKISVLEHGLKEAQIMFHNQVRLENRIHEIGKELGTFSTMEMVHRLSDQVFTLTQQLDQARHKIQDLEANNLDNTVKLMSLARRMETYEAVLYDKIGGPTSASLNIKEEE